MQFDPNFGENCILKQGGLEYAGQASHVHQSKGKGRETRIGLGECSHWASGKRVFEKGANVARVVKNGHEHAMLGRHVSVSKRRPSTGVLRALSEVAGLHKNVFGDPYK